MKKLGFLLARSGAILFGLAMMALVLPYLIQAFLEYHGNITRHYLLQGQDSALLLHLPHLAQILGGVLFGLSGYFILRDHFYRTTLLATFTLCVLAAHGLINHTQGIWHYFYIPAMFAGCLGVLALVFTHWLSRKKAQNPQPQQPAQPGALVL